MDIRTVTKLAREIMPDIVAQPIDAVAACERAGDEWRVIVDVIESHARLGDDDLLAVYELTLSDAGDLNAYRRLGRRRRFEDAGFAAAS
ncbi:MAG: gas vesicle protein GvpO [Pseudomonadota bacterium]